MRGVSRWRADFRFTTSVALQFVRKWKNNKRYCVSNKTCLVSCFEISERTRPTKPFPYLSFFFGGGVWGGAEQKIERKWFWSGGRTRRDECDVARRLLSVAHRRAREKARARARSDLLVIVARKKFAHGLQYPHKQILRKK